jgi:hypothetical protein
MATTTYRKDNAMTKAELQQRVERLEWALRQVRTECERAAAIKEKLACGYNQDLHDIEQSPYYILGALEYTYTYIDGLAQRAIEEVEALV